MHIFVEATHQKKVNGTYHRDSLGTQPHGGLCSVTNANLTQ